MGLINYYKIFGFKETASLEEINETLKQIKDETCKRNGIGAGCIDQNVLVALSELKKVTNIFKNSEERKVYDQLLAAGTRDLGEAGLALCSHGDPRIGSDNVVYLRH